MRMLAIGVNHKWDACPSKGSTQAPVHPHFKLSKYRTRIVPNANHMSVMKTSLTIIPMCPRERFSLYKSFPGLSFATKRIGPPCCTLFTFVTCCLLQFILSQNYLLPLISVLAENTLPETAYHFLLLLVGFDTLTYRKDYDRSHVLMGHQDSFLVPLLGSEAPLVGGIW